MTEKNAIAKAVQHYIDGAKSGSSAEMRRAFHADATIFGYEGDSLFARLIQRLFDWHDQNGPAADLEASIVNIDVAGTIATVRLELDNWTGTNYTDLFTMLKVDGHWKIMNKVIQNTIHAQERENSSTRRSPPKFKQAPLPPDEEGKEVRGAQAQMRRCFS